MDIVVHPIRFTIPTGFVDYTPYIFTLDKAGYQLELVLADKTRNSSLHKLALDHLKDRKAVLGKRLRIVTDQEPIRPITVDERPGVMATVEYVADGQVYLEDCEFIDVSPGTYLRLFFRRPRRRMSAQELRVSAINTALRIDRPPMQKRPPGFMWYQMGPIQLLLSRGWTPPEAFFFKVPGRELSLSVKTTPAVDLLERSPLEMFGIPQHRAQPLPQDESFLNSDTQQFMIREPEADANKTSLAVTSRRRADDHTVVVLGRQFDTRDGDGQRLHVAVHDLLQSLSSAPPPSAPNPLQGFIRPSTVRKHKARSSSKRSNRRRKRNK
jgi:hypothetical protein